jgi:hypothetical protein
MDASAFAAQLLQALGELTPVQQVSLDAEGPVVRGQAFLEQGRFLAFYYNQATGTQALAFIEQGRRTWGIDYDNLRGWHIHPMENPDLHLPTSPLTVAEIIQHFVEMLNK